MKTLKKLYSSIFLLILGLIMAKTQIVIGDGCHGMVEGIIFFFLSVVYILTLLMILIFSTLKRHKNREPFNYFPVLTTFLVVILIYVSFHPDKLESETILFAKSNEHHSISLRKDKTFKLHVQSIEWSCYYHGDYKIAGDTLYLLRNDIPKITNYAFSKKYLISKDELLYPMNDKDILQDNDRILEIVNKEKY